MKRALSLFAAAWLASACNQAPPSMPTVVPNATFSPPSVAPSLVGATRINVGETVTARVEVDSPRCFPEWDYAARCRVFKLTAEAVGTLMMTLAWTHVSGEWDPDLLFVNAAGGWTWMGDGTTPRTVFMSVDRGTTYHIVVMSYTFRGQEFALSTAVR
jgi:hypothetical protein